MRYDGDGEESVRPVAVRRPIREAGRSCRTKSTRAREVRPSRTRGKNRQNAGAAGDRDGAAFWEEVFNYLMTVGEGS